MRDWLLIGIMVMVTVQFLAMLWLIGGISNQIIYLNDSVKRLKLPVRNAIVTVAFAKETKMFTVLGNKLYSVVPVGAECK